MCNYLQSGQSDSIDLVNLLITSREMFLLFFWYYLWNASHFLPCLNLYFKCGTKPLQNTSTVEILKCIRNCVNSAINPNFLLLVGIVENCPTEKG